MTEYGPDGEPSGLNFRVNVKGNDINFSLPVEVAGVAAALKRDRNRHDTAHARRVAWRIVKDWCDSQMALIDAGQAELAQVFLPYARTQSGETFYKHLQNQRISSTDGTEGRGMTQLYNLFCSPDSTQPIHS